MAPNKGNCVLYIRGSNALLPSKTSFHRKKKGRLEYFSKNMLNVFLLKRLKLVFILYREVSNIKMLDAIYVYMFNENQVRGVISHDLSSSV